jgi:hypothetical protein
MCGPVDSGRQANLLRLNFTFSHGDFGASERFGPLAFSKVPLRQLCCHNFTVGSVVTPRRPAQSSTSNTRMPPLRHIPLRAGNNLLGNARGLWTFFRVGGYYVVSMSHARLGGPNK